MLTILYSLSIWYQTFYQLQPAVSGNLLGQTTKKREQGFDLIEPAMDMGFWDLASLMLFVLLGYSSYIHFHSFTLSPTWFEIGSAQGRFRQFTLICLVNGQFESKVQLNNWRISAFQSQQEEIKFHGKWIKSLLRKCEDKCEWDAVKDLEERWHKIRLRVLEWQYFLEGLTWTGSSNEVSQEYTEQPIYMTHKVNFRRTKSLASIGQNIGPYKCALLIYKI